MSDMGLGTKSVGTTTAVNLNQAQNTVLFTHVFTKPARVTAHQVIAVTGNIELAGRVKLRKNTLAVPGTFADIAGSVGGVTADLGVGSGYRKEVGAQVSDAGYSAYDVLPGESVVIAVEVSNGATGTAQVALEYVEHGNSSPRTITSLIDSQV